MLNGKTEESAKQWVSVTFVRKSALDDLKPIKSDFNPFRKIATQKREGHP